MGRVPRSGRRPERNRRRVSPQSLECIGWMGLAAAGLCTRRADVIEVTGKATLTTRPRNHLIGAHIAPTTLFVLSCKKFVPLGTHVSKVIVFSFIAHRGFKRRNPPFVSSCKIDWCLEPILLCLTPQTLQVHMSISISMLVRWTDIRHVRLRTIIPAVASARFRVTLFAHFGLSFQKRATQELGLERTHWLVVIGGTR